jgi:riboflavin synthase
MFTGIVEAIGTVEALEQKDGDISIRVNTGKLDLSDVQLGDSICTNGCCLTVVELTGNGYVADVSTETLSVTTLDSWKVGTRVNLEKSLTLMTRMGGHMVSGHVDGVAEVLSRENSARADVFWIKAPEQLAKYIAHKGSVTIDGTSLTVNEVNGNEFCLTIVPHTLQETVMGDYEVGALINIEVDLVARYLERLQLGSVAATKN